MSRELLRRREWGRYWCRRWASIELVLGLSLLGLVHPSPDLPERSEWLLILRMTEPDVREQLRE
ncbi:MAG: hypothetical protein RLP09_11940 [Sandaracinaceae bacterium]